MLEKIKQMTEVNYDKLVEIRRFIHAHPETGFEEYQTSKLIKDELMKLGCFEIEEVAGTGIVALFKGQKPSSNQPKCLAIRADMDALMIPDYKDVSYRSQNPGLCHACGHDVHVTMLLGVAYNLAKLQKEISGYVKLFFQPAEETDGGALPMIEAGCMENPVVDAIIGIHITSGYKVGQVRFCYGTMQASSTDLIVTVYGKSAHAAHPESGVDAIVVASNMIMALQTVVARNISPVESGCITIGKIAGGTANNALAEVVKFSGTIRTLDVQTTDTIKQRINTLLKSIASSYNATVEITMIPGYVPLVNDDKMVNFMKEIASEVVGLENIYSDRVPSLGVEDFAYFAQKAPACFYNIGTSSGSKETSYPGHNSHFDIDERSMVNGVVINTKAIMEFLN